MNRRLLNFLGLVGYMNANHALNTDDLKNAATYLNIFKMADPQNPDCDFLFSLLYIKSNNPKESIAALNRAATLGFSDMQQLTSNPLFANLQKDEEFQEVLQKVKKNIVK